MRALLDTNALLWSSYAPERLTKKAVAAFLEADELYFSILSPWEVALKFSRGGLHGIAVPQDWEKTLISSLLQQGHHLLTLDLAHCRQVQDLPFHHKDPFDRMLISQALVENLTVIGSDDRFDDYGVTRIW